MAILYSFKIGPVQADGKQYVDEVHVGLSGVQHLFSWKYDGSQVPASIVAQRATVIESAQVDGDLPPVGGL